MSQQQIKLLCCFIYSYCIVLQNKLIYIFFRFNDNICTRGIKFKESFVLQDLTTLLFAVLLFAVSFAVFFAVLYIQRVFEYAS